MFYSRNKIDVLYCQDNCRTDKECTPGVSKGHTIGIDKGHTSGIDKGHTSGIDKGHTSGVDKGHTSGVDKGHTSEINQGHTCRVGKGNKSVNDNADLHQDNVSCVSSADTDLHPYSTLFKWGFSIFIIAGFLAIALISFTIVKIVNNSSDPTLNPSGVSERGRYRSGQNLSSVNNSDFAVSDSSSITIASTVTCGMLGNRRVSESDFYKTSQTNPTVLKIHGRIVGGTSNKIQNHPWQVYLRGGAVLCGGSIIKPNWILFAAHCVTDFNNKAADWKVYSGVTELKNFNVFGQRATGTKLIVHEKFSLQTYENDIALLQISPSLNYNDFIRPICLPPSNLNLPTNTHCHITGWGMLEEDGQPSTTLKVAEVDLLSKSICNQPDWLDDMVSDNMICAGHYGGLIDGCIGDSGGPLACPSGSGEKYLYGIASWGIGCAKATKPGVYTRVTRYIDWIERNRN